MSCAGHEQFGEAPAGVEEGRARVKNPDDLPRVVDAEGLRRACVWEVELGEAPADV